MNQYFKKNIIQKICYTKISFITLKHISQRLFILKRNLQVNVIKYLLNFLNLNIMKKVFQILSILSLLGFSSCNEDIGNVNVDIDLPQTRNVSQNVSSVFDWENTTSIVLPEYGNTILPWYNATESNIPDYIIRDYKKADGWEMVYNFCNDPVLAKKGKYYLMFYNKLTGILRVFYYNIYNVTTANTTLWKIGFNNKSALINSIDHFTLPADNQTTSFAYITNILDLPAKAMAKGWNCFDVELCYDPQYSSKEIKMSIGVYDVSTQNITLTGNINLQSEGTIISVTNKNPTSDLLDGASQSFGKSAADSITNNLGKKILPDITKESVSTLLSGGIKGFVKNGINLIFGSFLGKLSSTAPLTQDISFKTVGTVNIKGTINSQQQSNILPVANLVVPGGRIGSSDNIIPSFNKTLGVWNISSTPTIQMSDEAVWVRKSYTFPGNLAQYDYRRKVVLDPSSVNVIINPEVENIISNYTVSTEIVYYDSYEEDKRWGSKYYNGYTSWYDMTGISLFSGEGLHIYLQPDIDQNIPRPSYPINKQVERIDRFGVERWLERNCGIFNPNYVVKVSVTLYPKTPYNSTPIIMTKSYIPTYKIVKGLLDYKNEYN